MVDVGTSVAEYRVQKAVGRSFADDKLGVDLFGYLVIGRVENESVRTRINGTYSGKQIAVNFIVILCKFVILVLAANRV